MKKGKEDLKAYDVFLSESRIKVNSADAERRLLGKIFSGGKTLKEIYGKSAKVNWTISNWVANHE